MQVQMHIADPALNSLFGINTQAKAKPTNRFYEAVGLEQQQKLKEAADIYVSLMDDHFQNSALCAALGMNLAVQGKHGIANQLLSYAYEHHHRLIEDMKALGVEQNQVKPERFAKMKKAELANAIGTTWKNENKTEKARYWFERAKDIMGEANADIENNLATLYINEGKPERALPHLQEAIRIQPDHPQARWNRSLAYLETGDYANGFDEYHWGKRASVRLDRKFNNTREIPHWDGTKGQRIVVYGEQGIGDEILFASVIPDLIRDSAEVVFECHKKLHRLFCASFPDIPIYGTREDEQIQWPFTSDGKPRYVFDAKIALGDLPKFYRRKLDDFPGTPYIKCSTEAELRWAQKLNAQFTDDKPVIGINWIGGMKKTRVEVRSLTLEQLLPVLKQDAHFVSLQYTDCANEIFEFEQKYGIKIHHWPEATQGENYDECAGIVANLDLVITNCSSVVHLAGSMGVPTWVLTPSRPAWRYRLDLDYMPWYGKSVTLFRQRPESTDWTPVIAEVAEALADMDVRHSWFDPTATLPEEEAS